MNVTDIFKNYSRDAVSFDLDTDTDSGSETSSISRDNLHGGDNPVHFPSGGFPPIYVCSDKKNELSDDVKMKKKGYKTHKMSVSIKTLMEKRREQTPFVAIKT